MSLRPMARQKKTGPCGQERLAPHPENKPAEWLPHPYFPVI